jgi:hypothetical protein
MKVNCDWKKKKRKRIIKGEDKYLSEQPIVILLLPQ